MRSGPTAEADRGDMTTRALPGDGGSPRWTSGTRSTWPDRRTLPSVAKTAVKLRFSPSKPISTCATAGAMAPPAPSSPGKASMTVPPARGRGWAALGGAGRLVGHIFIHRGDRSGFVAEHE